MADAAPQCASATTSPDAAGCTRVRVAAARALRPRHSVENQWDLLRRSGSGRRMPATPSGRDDRRPAAPQPPSPPGCARRGVDERDGVIVMHVSAGNPFRRWPIESFATLVATLARGGPGRRVIVITPDRPSARPRPRRRRRRGRSSTPGEARACRRAASSRSPSSARWSTCRALHRRRQRPDAHRRRRARVPMVGSVRPDTAGALGAVAIAAVAGRGGRSRRPALPALRSAGLRARRLPLPHAGSGPSRSLARRASAPSAAPRRRLR